MVSDNTYDFEFWINPEGHYLYASPSCKRVTGYDTKDFLSNSALQQDIIHPDDKQNFLEHVSNEVLNKKLGELEFRIIHKDGSIKWIHHICQPINDENGKFLGTRGSNRDITERKLMEDKLKELTDGALERVGAATTAAQRAQPVSDLLLHQPKPPSETKRNCGIHSPPVRRVVVAVYDKPLKSLLFSPEERIDLVRRSFDNSPKIEVMGYSGLTVNFCHTIGAQVIVRGLRVFSDFSAAGACTRLWKIGDWKNAHDFKGHTNAVNSVAFSPKGEQLASAGAARVDHPAGVADRPGRAGIEDVEHVEGLGVNVYRLFTITFIIAGILSGLAGACTRR
jgi:PAS domain S-box-containing protein